MKLFLSVRLAGVSHWPEELGFILEQETSPLRQEENVNWKVLTGKVQQVLD